MSYQVRVTLETIDQDGNVSRQLVDTVQTFASRYTWNAFANATVEALLNLSKAMNEQQASGSELAQSQTQNRKSQCPSRSCPLLVLPCLL